MRRYRRVLFLILVVVAAVAATTVARADSLSTANQMADDDADKARGMFIW